MRNGATFISTNGDIAIPTERGLLPGNGSLTSVVAVSTGVSNLYRKTRINHYGTSFKSAWYRK